MLDYARCAPDIDRVSFLTQVSFYAERCLHPKSNGDLGMTSSEKWTLVIQGAVAVGTLGAVVMAIWGDWVRSILASPRLMIKLRDNSGEPTNFPDGSAVRYYHIAVSNGRRWAPAKNVVVYLTRLEKPSPDGSWHSALFSGPLPLTWQFAKFSAGLPSIGHEKYCDLGRIIKGRNFEILTQFKPNNFDPCLYPKGKLRAHFSAIGENARSAGLIVEIAWDGQWVEGAREMEQHLVVKEIQASV